MAGHMGHEQVTVQNAVVVKVDIENQLLLVHGSVPGPRSGIVMIRKATKTKKVAPKARG
jgi:large subunit ribosomal protein L3